MTDQARAQQQLFPSLCPISDAVARASVSGSEERGAIFMRREVVDFILDLAGYSPDHRLFEYRLLAPSL